MSYQDIEAKSEKAERARTRLQGIVQKGAEQQQAVIENVLKRVIRDRLLLPSRMVIYSHTPSEDIRLEYIENDGSRTRATIHRHAFNQICAQADYPTAFARKMRDGKVWERELVARDLNEIYEKRPMLNRNREPKKFLHRLVNDELRAFLTASYNPFLSTRALLRPFVETCGEFGAGPVEAHVTDLRVVVKCCLPYVFEPVEGEFVAFGSTFSNSDFGAGGCNVSLTAMRVSSGTISVVDKGYKRVHLGRVLQQSDIEMDSDTAKKETDTHAAAIRQAVREQLKVSSIEVMLAAIKKAAEHKLSWVNLQAQIKAVLSKEDISVIEQILLSKGDDIIDLPKPHIDEDGDAIPTKWWAANVLGFMARKQKDDDRREEIQTLAGSILGVKENAA